MDEPTSQPLVFANRFIRMYADHLCGADLVILPKDFTVLRVAFRKAGGNWEQVALGNIVHIQLLSKIVVAWGQMPDRKRKTEMG